MTNIVADIGKALGTSQSLFELEISESQCILAIINSKQFQEVYTGERYFAVYCPEARIVYLCARSHICKHEFYVETFTERDEPAGRDIYIASGEAVIKKPCKYSDAFLDRLHQRSVENYTEVVSRSQKCGCFRCQHFFNSDDAISCDESNGSKTAVCPNCGIDAVICESMLEEELDITLLAEMQDKYF